MERSEALTMPRPREFEPEDVVAAAMEVFWRQGYQGTSLQNLVDETGINRGSLYSVFRDKHSLFLEALRHYRTTVVPGRILILEAPSDGLSSIRQYFEAVAGDLQGPACGRGCLMVNSAIELAAVDSEVAEEVGRHLDRLRKGFAISLERAVELGELARSSRVRPLARYLTAVAQGLIVIGKATPDRQALREIYEPALSALA